MLSTWSTTAALFEELRQQVDALNHELTRLKGAGDPAAQQQGMQCHCSMMQEHTRSVCTLPGMHAQGCSDRMMMERSTMDCPMMGHGMGPGGMWGMPSGMNPGMYPSQMQGYMTRVRSQMAAIAVEKDPTKRDALLREHYETMYGDMQTMRKMG